MVRRMLKEILRRFESQFHQSRRLYSLFGNGREVRSMRGWTLAAHILVNKVAVLKNLFI